MYIPHLGTRIRQYGLGKLLPETGADKNLKVLDAGCGFGTNCRYLMDKGYKVTGIDINRYRLMLAKLIAGKAEIKYGDIFKLPLAKPKFAGAICIEVLEHLDQDNLAVKKLAQVIKKGGFLIVSFPGTAQTEKVYQKLGHVRQGYSLKMAEKLAEDSGFMVKEIMAYGNTNFGQRVLMLNYHLGIWGIILVPVMELLMKKDIAKKPGGEVSGWIMRWQRK
jgi:2-polyprenyl-3-methyl-5-hydroxy-6-metoxy-1,4-benzoquinol methylase